MLFRRRDPLSVADKIRGLVWPRAGMRRALRYGWLRLMRLSASPRSVAAGAAIGVGVAWTPFVGGHLVLALALGWLCRVNLAAAALGAGLSNPLTFPFIGAITWELGRVILGGAGPAGAAGIDFAGLAHHFDIMQLWKPVFQPMMVGAIAPGLACALASYIAVYLLASAFRRRRHRHFIERRLHQETPA